MKLKKKYIKTWVTSQYGQRGRNNRIRKAGGWAALVERQIIEELSKSISKEIDKEILRRLQEYAETNTHS
jgi:hypothetical protein